MSQGVHLIFLIMLGSSFKACVTKHNANRKKVKALAASIMYSHIEYKWIMTHSWDKTVILPCGILGKLQAFKTHFYMYIFELKVLIMYNVLNIYKHVGYI